MEKLMGLRNFVQQVKKSVPNTTKPIEKVSDFLSEALEYKSGNDEQFAVDLVAEIDDNIGSIDGEISKDSRPGKNTGKRIGVQIVLPDSKRIAFTSMANEVISKDSDLELKKPSSTRAKKDFLFKHKDMEKDIYVQTRPDGKRGGGAKADPNELMTAALCTLTSVPKIETVEDLDALIEQVKQITKNFTAQLGLSKKPIIIEPGWEPFGSIRKVTYVRRPFQNGSIKEPNLTETWDDKQQWEVKPFSRKFSTIGISTKPIIIEAGWEPFGSMHKVTYLRRPAQLTANQKSNHSKNILRILKI